MHQYEPTEIDDSGMEAHSGMPSHSTLPARSLECRKKMCWCCTKHPNFVGTLFIVLFMASFVVGINIISELKYFGEEKCNCVTTSTSVSFDPNIMQNVYIYVGNATCGKNSQNVYSENSSPFAEKESCDFSDTKCNVEFLHQEEFPCIKFEHDFYRKSKKPEVGAVVFASFVPISVVVGLIVTMYMILRNARSSS